MDVKERNQQICERRKEGWSVNRLSQQFGITGTQISNILKAEGIIAKTKRNVIPEKPISQHHAQLGVRVSRVRSTDKQQNATDFGREVGLTAYRVNLIEAGRYDPTLSEIHRLAEYMEMSINELLVFKDKVTGVKNNNVGN